LPSRVTSENYWSDLTQRCISIYLTLFCKWRSRYAWFDLGLWPWRLQSMTASMQFVLSSNTPTSTLRRCLALVVLEAAIVNHAACYHS